MNGLQCLKYLWITFNDRGRIPETDTVTQYLFDQGHLVGEVAKRLFPGGMDIPQGSLTGIINNTKALLGTRKPLFEAGIQADSIYSRIDVLDPANDDEWDIVEVKSSTSVKKVHVDDVAFQRHCCEMGGLKIRKCSLALIDNKYVRNGEIDPHGLFNIHDISDRVVAASEGIQDGIEAMLDIAKSPYCPEMPIGQHCRKPYECPLSICWDHLPEDNVFDLFGGGAQGFQFYNQGILSIRDIPDDHKMSGKQRIHRDCVISGEPLVNEEGIRAFLSTLQYPLYFFDFETVGSAVPPFDGTWPYQDVPFQFSLHVVNSEGDSPAHYSFLASGTDDPRRSVIEELSRLLGAEGSIIVYFQDFEEGILKELGQAFPEYEDWVAQVCSGLVDLYAPFGSYHYYHPSQKNSASLKRVLPAITGRGYDGLEINEGQSASIAFQRVTYGEVSGEEKQKVRHDLIEYCGRDTEGMIWIVDELRNLCDAGTK
jgi:hypothetical protein